jgi:hypothetical protein
MRRSPAILAELDVQNDSDTGENGLVTILGDFKYPAVSFDDSGIFGGVVGRVSGSDAYNWRVSGLVGIDQEYAGGDFSTWAENIPTHPHALVAIGKTALDGDVFITGSLVISGSDGDSSNHDLLTLYHNGTSGYGQGIMIVRNDSTTAADEILGGIGFDSNDGNVPQRFTQASAFIAAYASQNHGVGEKGGHLAFGTAPFNQNDDTNSTEAMRITDGQNVLIGRTTEAYTTKDPLLEVDGYVSFDGFVERAGTGGSDNGGNIINFHWDGSNLEGWVDTTEVVSAITSDYRIKENVTPIQDGVLGKINQLNPINYTQASCSIFPQITGSIKTSLIAHEIQEVFPDLVIGEKDAMNEDGTPLLQKFKGKELTIYLLKAVQELSQKVDSLEAQISGSN